MPYSGIPWWAVAYGAIALLPAVALALAILWEFFGPRPVRRVQLPDMTIELWVRERRLPKRSGAIIAPVAPDLKMAIGIAKWVRDSTAGIVQQEALDAAPLPPGEAFVGSGGKYRFKVAALAVVMDAQKRTSPEWIASAIRRAMERTQEKGADTCLLPDMTEDLLRQPQWITDEKRRETCRPIARAMLDGALASRGVMEVVRIWVWRAVNADVWMQELDRLEQEARQTQAVEAA
jgi:O-acetyl-ADP-ribose deacetylase (regulator of RNase III)